MSHADSLQEKDSKIASQQHHRSFFARARRVIQTLNDVALTDVLRNVYVSLCGNGSLTPVCAG